MQVPIDSNQFNVNVKGATGYEPVVDFDTGQQKSVGPDGEKQLQWVIKVSYEDASDQYGEEEVLKVKYASNADPDITFGPIQLGGVRAQTWEVATKGGVLKNGISFACDTYTQDPAPSSKRATASPSEPPVPSSKAAK